MVRSTDTISEIRILPMGKKGEFETKSEVDAFFLHDLKRWGQYYFRKQSFANDAQDRLFVLFQYEGCLVGCAEKVDQVPEETDDGYYGYYQFDPDTVRLFDYSIPADVFLSLVDNSINGFNQVLHRIDVGYLERIVTYINQNCFEPDTETMITGAQKTDLRTGQEGKRTQYYGTRYERVPSLREAALAINRCKYGSLTCEVCKSRLEEQFGEYGVSAMEVHHIVPLGEVRCEHDVDPETDLVCLCANCDRMMHHAIRKHGYSLTAAELSKKLREQ